MSFVDELKQAHGIENKRSEEQAIAQKNKDLEEYSTKVHEIIRNDSMGKAKIGRTHTEGYVARGESWNLDLALQHYENLPIVGRRDSEGALWNDGGECSAVTINGEFCDEIIAMASDLLRKDGFVNFTLSRCPCHQKSGCAGSIFCL